MGLSCGMVSSCSGTKSVSGLRPPDQIPGYDSATQALNTVVVCQIR